MTITAKKPVVHLLIQLPKTRINVLDRHHPTIYIHMKANESRFLSVLFCLWWKTRKIIENILEHQTSPLTQAIVRICGTILTEFLE